MMLQFEPPQHSKLKLSRTSTNKVRTGCITCKRRHIKCDEGKPQCSNCLKSRGHCDGYVPEQRRKPPVPGQFCWDSKVIRGVSPRLHLQVDPDALDFRDATAMLYFHEFVDLVQSPWNTAASTGDLWGTTLPQLARNNSTLRYAAMAIGALSRWHRLSTRNSLRSVSVPTLPAAEGDTHYFQAVGYYCHSLKLQSQRSSVQDAVFMSLLLLFFETLRGNRKAALDHVNHGLTLLLGLLTDEDGAHKIAQLGPNPKPVLGAVADIFGYLASQARTVLRDRVDRGPPLPNFAKALRNKKQTMVSFVVLLSQLPLSAAPVNRVPAVFTSLDEFEESWTATRQRQMTMAPIIAEVVQASGVQRSTDEGEIQKFCLELLGNERIKEFCENSRTAMQALDAAFLPLFNQILMSDASSPSYLRAIHLRLQYLGVYIFEDTSAYFDVETIRSRTPLFREYLSVAELALRTAKRGIQNPAYRLSLHCELSMHLLILAFFCRDPLARDQAVSMLKDYPGQDGLWNTPALYALALRNRSVERINATEGTSAEQWQRLWRREFIFEDAGERIVLRYLDKDAGTGEWKMVEEATLVQGEPDDVQWQRQPLTGSGGLLMTDLFDELH